MTVSTLVVDIPPNEWLTANGRYGNPYGKARRTKRLRQRGCALARAQRLPTYSRLVRIKAYVHGRVNRWFDPNNADPTTKALVDGLRDAGVLVDDNWTRVVGHDHRYGEPVPSLPKGWHRITLTITPTE